MHIFMDNLHQGRKYSYQIDSHQEELRREENFTDQKCLSISSLQNYYLNLDIISGYGKIVIEQIFSIQSALFLEVPNILQKTFQNNQKVKVKLSCGW